MNRLLEKITDVPAAYARDLVLGLACLFAVTGCATLGEPSSTIESDVRELKVNVAALEKGLDTRFTAICSAQNEQSRTQIKSLKKEREKNQKRYATLKQKCEASTVADKLLVGEVENVTLIDEKMTLSARIDTGAETSSLGVYRLQEFERDGRNWVRFKLKNTKSAPQFEYRVRGRVSIKQGSESEGEQRLEIKVDVRLGKKNYPNQVFNLADRSFLEHQVLIGRSFLTDVAIVDTSAKYLLKKS